MPKNSGKKGVKAAREVQKSAIESLLKKFNMGDDMAAYRALKTIPVAKVNEMENLKPEEFQAALNTIKQEQQVKKEQAKAKKEEAKQEEQPKQEEPKQDNGQIDLAAEKKNLLDKLADQLGASKFLEDAKKGERKKPLKRMTIRSKKKMPKK